MRVAGASTSGNEQSKSPRARVARVGRPVCGCFFGQHATLGLRATRDPRGWSRRDQVAVGNEAHAKVVSAFSHASVL